MYDHPHLCYLNHNQPERFEPLIQAYHDMKPTCKKDFIDIQHLSIFLKPYFACHDVSVPPPLMLILLLFLKMTPS